MLFCLWKGWSVHKKLESLFKDGQCHTSPDFEVPLHKVCIFGRQFRWFWITSGFEGQSAFPNFGLENLYIPLLKFRYNIQCTLSLGETPHVPFVVMFWDLGRTEAVSFKLLGQDSYSWDGFRVIVTIRGPGLLGLVSRFIRDAVFPLLKSLKEPFSKWAGAYISHRCGTQKLPNFRSRVPSEPLGNPLFTDPPKELVENRGEQGGYRSWSGRPENYVNGVQT